MRVLHLNTYPYGGAFTGAYRLHCALKNSGISSVMLVSTGPLNRELDSVNVICGPKRKPSFFNKISSNLGYPVTYNQKYSFYTKNLECNDGYISFPFSDYDITKSKEYAQADIIHLHWIAKFVDYRSFFKKCNKPIIITLRDLFPILGIFHYEISKETNTIDLKLLDEEFIKYKSDALSCCKAKITVTGISNWITQKSLQSESLKSYNHITVHNCININNFVLIPKEIARKNLNISMNSIVFSIVDDGSSDNRKGTDLLVEAMKQLNIDKEVVIVIAGRSCDMYFSNNIVVRNFGVCGREEMNLLYCASDAFIFPTKEEAFGNVMIEAMACGIPVIGTPVGGLLDVIIPKFNGLISEDVTADGLKNAIYEFIEIKNSFDNLKIRNYINENFSEELASKKYLEIYSNALSSIVEKK